jgi:DNA repair protein RadA/Sms
MASKRRTIFVCQNCGYQAPKWLGRCPDCSEWNCLVEEVKSTSRGGKSTSKRTTQAVRIDDISLKPEMRFKSGVAEFDRVLGGGLVPGSLVLIGGDPGIGKSTIILQVLEKLSLQGFKALYLSGEESSQQIRLRADRLGIASKHLFVMTGTCVEETLETIDSVKPDVIAVDSIQTVYTEALSSAPGSIGQVREVASYFMSLAKASGTPVFLVGHVTKDGAIAGPKTLEHLVDTVLYFEGDGGHLIRILRSEKNRYGSTNEIGVFEMKDSGLEEVRNPSRIFLQERPEDVPGSVVISCLEGTRPVLVEIQALVGPSPLGMPRRTAIGVDHNRISLLVAVLGKKISMELGDQDIFINVAGGLRIDEPAADMGIISAMMSSFLDRPVARDLVVFGEVGLAGEIRAVSQPELRLKEAAKLGFTSCLMATTSLDSIKPPPALKVTGIKSIQELYDFLYGI